VYNILYGPLSHLPGPFITKISNVGLKRATLQGRKMYYLDNLHKRYGPVVRISPDEASIIDLVATREIHKITGGFRKTPWYTAFTNYGVNNMFTMINVKEHSARRRLLGQPLSETALKSVQPLVREKTQLAMSKLNQQLQEEGYMDVLRWFHYMSVDIISDLSFGESFGLLEAGEVSSYMLQSVRVRRSHGDKRTMNSSGTCRRMTHTADTWSNCLCYSRWRLSCLSSFLS
jgi:cytochrome P450